MPEKNLRNFFIENLHDIYDAEKRLLMALPKLVTMATYPRLRDALEQHIDQTEDHVPRLASVYESIHEVPVPQTCTAIVGLLAGGDDLLRPERSPSIRDSALITAALKIEHFEAASYGCLGLWAETLDERSAAALLRKSFDEEVSAATALMSVAKSLHRETANSQWIEASGSWIQRAMRVRIAL